MIQKFSYSNDFEKASELNKKLIKLENDNVEKYRPIIAPKGKSKIAPIDIEDDTFLEYFEIKAEYKKTIKKLLAIRRGFSQKLKIDALPSITTQNDEISRGGVQYDNYRVEEFNKSKRWVDLRRDYIPKLLIITLLSLTFGLAVAIIILFTDYYDLFGMYIVCSKGFSISILITIAF